MIGPIYIPKLGSYKVRTLLNWVPGAIHAVSVDRLLKSDYGGPVAQIRNTANNAEARFTWNNWIGGSAEGFASDSSLVTAFDQTGNRRHWQQGTTSAQPWMVTGGQYERYTFEGHSHVGMFCNSGDTHWMEVLGTQGLLPTLTDGFTMAIRAGETQPTTGVPPIFGNIRGVQNYHEGSFGVDYLGTMRNEVSTTVRRSLVGSSDPAAKVVVAVFTSSDWAKYTQINGVPGRHTAVSSGVWLNSAVNSNLRLMVATGTTGGVVVSSRLYGHLSTTILWPRPVTADEASIILDLI